ncbi:MAG TPA: hypothetical protein DHW02_04575 [Ktedonobacter sp.]|nr:hypothetical protein [Ktedonobacter sp.]
MRFSSRPKVSVSISLAFFFVCAFSLYGFVGSTNTAHAASAATSTSATTSFKGTLSSAHRVGTVNPAALAKASGHAAYKVMPMRSRPSGGNASPAIGGRPNTVSTSVAAGSLLHNFNGVDAIDNANVNGFDLEPPDEGLGDGNGYVFNIVNDAGAIYRSNGSVVLPAFSINPFFAESSTAFLSDPRTYYDPTTNTWFATVLEIGATNTESHFDVAVNKSGNPTTDWTVYKFDTTDPTGANCPCFGDYPIFGIDKSNIYVSSQEFPISGSGYNGAEIYVISKAQLEAYATSVNVIRFGSLSVDGVLGYHIQPAIEHTSASAEYFLNSLDPNNTFDNRLGVWAMTNRDHVAQGVIPNLSATVISSEAYAMPANAQTPPGVCPCPGAPFNGPLATSGVVTADFDAMQEVQYLNGHLYSSLNTSVNVAGDSGARDGVAWFDVTPVVSGGVISSKSKVVNQGYIASRGLYLMYPHTERTFSGNTVIAFTFGGPGTYLSAGYAVMPSGAKSFSGIRVAGAGVTSDNGFTSTSVFGGVGRWGDYSAGELDPSGNGVWLATQYIPNNGDQFANWGNRVFEVAA